MEPIIAIVLALVGYALGSAKIINEGNEALVERLGQKHRTLKPGLNFIVPFVDQVVMEDTTREQILDIKPQKVITKDNVYLEVDGVVTWQITNMEDSFYKVEDMQVALANLVTVELRAHIAERTLSETVSARNQMNQSLLQIVNDTSQKWGVKIIRVDIQSITPPESVQRSMAEQQAAEIRKQAAISEAEGERQAAIKRAEATKESIRILSEAVTAKPETREILRYLVAQEQLEASHKLSASTNAKVVFLNQGLSEGALDQMLGDTVGIETESSKSDNGTV
ncbi:SPFH/Band 7/PHB domain protein [Nostoc sp. FACHB-152]|uniref:SPFH domain-containing protein n=1 Tax=unclassified Nostoc TaxID=2593658 RepID=UPI00168569B7|nr:MULTISPECIES: SPFH domain-containing protein [unclassified Nostoc]MBD2450750.1 SPFH/Band 7/PHB domain protein [Nostoc sp. FACHB-152]MBD2470189.1 SPFH/Band 7/PHB domain protein [Nostoc sp. FACHB-145]